MVKIDMDRSSTAEEVQEGGERSAAKTDILRLGYQGWCRRHYHVHEDLCVEASEAFTRPSARDWQQTGGSEKMVVGEKRNGVVWLPAGRGDMVYKHRYPATTPHSTSTDSVVCTPCSIRQSD
jgi:hypothetical protein